MSADMVYTQNLAGNGPGWLRIHSCVVWVGFRGRSCLGGLKNGVLTILLLGSRNEL